MWRRNSEEPLQLFTVTVQLWRLVIAAARCFLLPSAMQYPKCRLLQLYYLPALTRGPQGGAASTNCSPHGFFGGLFSSSWSTMAGSCMSHQCQQSSPVVITLYHGCRVISLQRPYVHGDRLIAPAGLGHAKADVARQCSMHVSMADS